MLVCVCMCVCVCHPGKSKCHLYLVHSNTFGIWWVTIRRAAKTYVYVTITKTQFFVLISELNLFKTNHLLIYRLKCLTPLFEISSISMMVKSTFCDKIDSFVFDEWKNLCQWLKLAKKKQFDEFEGTLKLKKTRVITSTACNILFY